MLGISRQTDYATRLVLHLASLEPGTQVAIAEIARIRHLPIPFVRRLVGQLVKAGLLTSCRGSGGGVRLSRPSHDISLLDVVQAIEGAIALNHCVDHPEACVMADHCPGTGAWTGVTRALVANLAAIRFDTLASDPIGHLAAHAQVHAH
jgi:Rrf2 family protein